MRALVVNPQIHKLPETRQTSIKLADIMNTRISDFKARFQNLLGPKRQVCDVQ
jgi:hypothetical protein